MALISQAQNIRQFVTTHLTDVIDPTRHFRDDPDRATTGDQAFAIIRTPFNSYQLSVASAYITPPAGAPQECKQLGTVTFLHSATGQRIVGPKADKTWRDISRVIHEAELADGLADAKRALAEAAPHEVASCRVKLAELAERAKKWGIEAKLPPVPVDFEAPGNWTPQEQAALQTDKPPIVYNDPRHIPASQTVHPIDSASDAPAPYIGAPIIYITNPGEQISGMQEIPGHVVKVHSPDRITICITPDTSEICYKTNLPRRGSDAGNGHVHKYNCWDFNPGWLAEWERVAALEKAVASRNAAEWGNERVLNAMIGELVKRVAALEAAGAPAPASEGKPKPRRGRPPKSEKLEELVSEISEENRHPEIEGAELASDFDPPKEGEQAA